MYLEMGEYDKCIADCDAAVEKGRESRADYKVIARALTRKANALAKQERYEEAVETYHKSLTEHRCTATCSCFCKHLVLDSEQHFGSASPALYSIIILCPPSP